MKWLKQLSKKWKIALAAALASALLLTILSVAAASIKRIPDSQRLAERWAPDGGYAQVSVFYPGGTVSDEMQFRNFEYSLESEFSVEGIEAPTESARLWVSAYSASGKVRVTSEKTTIDANAVGVGGDFFQFHPMDLLYGSFISGSDLMQDGIVIDEDAAWQLFGSSDVAGMQVMIGGVPHYIAGVISRNCDAMEKKADADRMTVYLSYDSLSRYGTTVGISCYEMLLPNPVSGYGLGLVTEKLGVTGETSVAVENSGRYTLKELLEVIGAFGTRSMQTHGIIWPSWENAARGWEDVLALILVFQLLCACVLAVVGILACIAGYKFANKWLREQKAKREWRY